MDSGLAASFEIFEQRLVLLRKLASSLEQAQSAVVGSDVREIDRHSVRQRELCAALRRLNPGPGGAVARNPILGESRDRKKKMEKAPADDTIPPEIRERWNALAQELTQVEMEVGQLNRVYGALLRRAQRTLQIFLRVLANSDTTYALPECEPASAQALSREFTHV